MNGQTLRWPLIFALVVLVCGGGCIGPHWHVYQNNLEWVGLDEHTRARLDGLADPRPSDPEPTAGLSGKLLIYDFVQHIPENDAVPESQTIPATPGELNHLAGIDSVEAMTIRWDVTYPRPEGFRPLTAVEYQRVILDSANEAGGDLLLVKVAKKVDRDDFDITFSIAQFLTLGLAPTTFVSSEIELEAVLIDVESGYIYAVLSGEGDGLEITNFWNRGENTTEAMQEAYAEASQMLINRLEEAWPTMKQIYP